jgi:uncharacterized cupredoxin-like copper-binding protein
MNKRHLFLAGFVLAIMLGLAGCASAPVTAINITMTDYKYEPADVRVAAGQEITLTLKNMGAVEHEWVIMKVAATVPWGDADEPNVYWEHEVGAGQSETVKFTAPSAGEYQIVCGQPGHIEEGMVGKLTAYTP